MKQLSFSLFTMNSVEKSNILEAIKLKDKNAFRFYKSLFKYKKIPTYFIDDILTVASDKLSKSVKYNLELINSSTNVASIIPESDSCISKLKEFQKKSFDRINNLIRLSGYYKGLIIADDPGLGKTATSLCLAKSFLKSHDLFDSFKLVAVVPLTLVNDWKKSLSTAFPDFKISTNPNSDADIYILNYEKIKKLNFEPTVVIVDEAHNFHNITSNRYIELFNFIHSAQLVLLLTGTPVRDSIMNLLALQGLIDNKLSNYDVLFKLMELLQKYYKYVYKVLVKKFARIMSRSQKTDVFDNVGDLDMKPLVLKIDDFKFRKLKLGLNQIDEKMSNMIDVVNEFKSKKSNDYETARKIIKQYIYDLEPKDILQILKSKNLDIDFQLTKKYLELIVYQTKQAYNQKLWHTILDDTLSFIAEHNCKDLCNQIKNHKKVLIITKSRKVITKLQKMLFNTCGIQGINISANDSATERYNKIKQFETSSQFKYLISTYPIVEAGINLPFVDLILLLDMPYRPHSLIQAINRTQRLNNISDKITVRFVKLSYKYNILEHHYLIVSEVIDRVNQILENIKKES